MKTPLIKSTTKKRPSKSSQNGTFKSKLRANTGILEKLKEPQVLKKLGLEDQVPTSLLKSYMTRAIKINKVASDQYKDLITSTPHYTKTKGDQFFNNTGCSLLSPINLNSVRNSTNSDSNKVNNANRNASVIYIGTEAADPGDSLHMSIPKNTGIQNEGTSRKRSLRSKNGKSTNANDIQHDVQLPKKSKIPSRTKAKDKDVVKRQTRSNSHKSKIVDHSPVRATTPSKRAESEHHTRSKSKEQPNVKTPVKDPDKHMHYTTRSLTSQQGENDAEHIHLSKKESARQVSVSMKSLRSEWHVPRNTFNRKTTSPCADNGEVNESLEHDRTEFVNKTPRRDRNKTPQNKNSDDLVIHVSCDSGGKSTNKQQDSSNVLRSLNNKNIQTPNIPELVHAETSEIHKSQTEEPKSLPNLLDEIRSKKAENQIFGNDVGGKNNAVASTAHSRTLRFSTVQVGDSGISTSPSLSKSKKGRQDNNNDENRHSTVTKTANTECPRSPGRRSKNQTDQGESPTPLVDLMNEIESKRASTFAKNSHRTALDIVVADIAQADKDNLDQSTLRNNIAIGDQDKSASLHSIIDDIKSRISQAGTKNINKEAPTSMVGRPLKTTKTACQNTSASLFSKEGNRERKQKYDNMMIRLEILAREAELQRAGQDWLVESRNRGSVTRSLYPFVTGALTPTERRLALHNTIAKLQTLSLKRKTKNVQQTVNKQIQTSNRLSKSTSTSRPPSFRRSAVRSGWKRRNSRTITVIASNSSSSIETIDTPNIFDSLKEGNELDAINFSYEDDPDLSSFIVKPWRYVNDNAPQEQSESISLNFIRSEAQLQNSSEILSKRSGTTFRKVYNNTNDFSEDNSLNNRTLTADNCCSPRNNSSKSNRRFPILRSTIKQYVRRQTEAADRPAFVLGGKYGTLNASQKSNSETTRDISTVDTDDLHEKSVSNRAAGSGNNGNLPHSNREGIGSSRNVKKTNNMMQQTSFRENNINETLRKNQELVDKQTSPITNRSKNSPIKNIPMCVNRKLFVNLENSNVNPKPSFIQINRSNTDSEEVANDSSQPHNSEQIDASVSIKRKVSGKKENKKNKKLKSNKKKKDASSPLETHNSVSAGDVSGMILITDHNSEDNDNNKAQENEKSRSSLQQGTDEAQATTINEPLVETVDSTLKSHSSPGKNPKTTNVKSNSGEQRGSQRNTDVQQARVTNEDIATAHPSPSKNVSRAGRTKKSSQRNTDVHQTATDDSLARVTNDDIATAHPSPAVNISKEGKVKTRSKKIAKSPIIQDIQQDTNNESLVKRANDNKSNKGIGKGRGRKPKSSQINTDVQDTNQEPSTVNEFVTPISTQVTLSMTNRMNRRPRMTRSLLGDVDVSNILQAEGGGRPQRTRKPVKFHTNLNLEELCPLGYVPIDMYHQKARKTRKSSVSKGKENQKKNKKISDLPNVIVEEIASEAQETDSLPDNPNERSGQNVVASEQDNIISAAVLSQQVEEAQLTETEFRPPPRVSIRVRKDITADSGYVNSKSNDTERRMTIRKTRKDDSNLTSISNIRNEESASLLQPGPSQAQEIYNEDHLEQDAVDAYSGMLDKASNFSSAPRLGPSETAFESNETNFNDNRVVSQIIDDDFIRHVVAGDVYNLRYISRKPESNSFRKLGNICVSETVKDPENRFSAGYLRLDAGDQKRPTTGHKYSFVFNVVSGSVRVCVGDKQGIVGEGDFFYIPRGTEYSIKNLDSQRHLLLSYMRVKGGDP